MNAATTAAMIQAIKEFKAVKRNPKTGTANGNSVNGVKRRLVDKLMEAGDDRSTAWDIAHTIAKENNC